MNIETNLLEEYVNLVDTTMKQNTSNLEKNKVLFVIDLSLFFSFYLLYKYLSESCFF